MREWLNVTCSTVYEAAFSQVQQFISTGVILNNIHSQIVTNRLSSGNMYSCTLCTVSNKLTICFESFKENATVRKMIFEV